MKWDNKEYRIQETLSFTIRSTMLRACPELAEGTGFTIDYSSEPSVLSSLWALSSNLLFFLFFLDYPSPPGLY
jgi:hypothetical protein